MQTAVASVDVPRGRPRGIRRRFVFAALIVLILAQLLSGILTVSAIRKTSLDATITAVRIVGHDWSFRIQNALRFGKPITQMFGLSEILAGIRSDLPFLTVALVTLPDGSVVESNAANKLPPGLGQSVSTLLAQSRSSADQNGTLLQTRINDSYVFVLPVSGADKSLAGALAMLVPESVITESTRLPVTDAVTSLVVTTLLGALGLAAASLVLNPSASGGIQRWRLLIIPAVVLVAAQGVSSWRNIETFRDTYVATSVANVQRSVDRLGTDLQRLVDKNVRLQRLSAYDAPFGRMAADIPELGTVELDDASGSVIASFGAKQNGDGAQAAPTREILSSDGQTVVARLRATLSEAAISEGVKRRVLDAGTVLLTSALFGVELLVLFGVLMRQTVTRSMASGTVVDADAHHLLARPASFLLVFGWALPLSFVPLQMGQLGAEPLFGLSRDVTLALPISAEMGCALLTALVAGILTDRRGWHVPFVVGSLLCAVGALATTLVTGPIGYIGARAVVGLGYGLAWMGIQGYVFSWSSPRTRTQAIANLVAGIFAGQICGNVTGAMLASQIGFSSVFTAAAVLGLVPIFFAFAFMRGYFGRPRTAPSVSPAAPVPLPLAAKSGSALSGLLSDRNFLSLLLLSVVPFSVAQVGLLYYTLPVYLSRQGIEQGNIGRVMMIYGLSVIYIAPLLGRIVDRQARKKPFIVLGGLIGALGLGFTYLDIGLVALIASVFLLGVASSLGGPAQSSFALYIPSVQRVGIGRAMGIQRAADKLGQMIGPVAIGALFTFLGVRDGLAVTAVYYLGSTLLFFLIARDYSSAPVGMKGTAESNG